jgi:hypothetical protein
LAGLRQTTSVKDTAKSRKQRAANRRPFLFMLLPVFNLPFIRPSPALALILAHNQSLLSFAHAHYIYPCIHDSNVHTSAQTRNLKHMGWRDRRVARYIATCSWIFLLIVGWGLGKPDTWRDERVLY